MYLEVAQVKLLIKGAVWRYWIRVAVHSLGHALLVAHSTRVEGLNGLVLVQVSASYLEGEPFFQLIAYG